MIAMQNTIITYLAIITLLRIMFLALSLQRDHFIEF